MSRYLVYASAGLWLALFSISFSAFASTAANGLDSGRDMLRVTALLGWQAGAMAAALAALLLMLRLRAPRGLGLSLAGLGPLLVMALELILAVALMAWLVMRDPAERIDRFYGPGAAYSPTLR